jgi:hypothetical protein
MDIDPTIALLNQTPSRQLIAHIRLSRLPPHYEGNRAAIRGSAMISRGFQKSLISPVVIRAKCRFTESANRSNLLVVAAFSQKTGSTFLHAALVRQRVAPCKNWLTDGSGKSAISIGYGSRKNAPVIVASYGGLIKPSATAQPFLSHHRATCTDSQGFCFRYQCLTRRRGVRYRVQVSRGREVLFDELPKVDKVAGDGETLGMTEDTRAFWDLRQAPLHLYGPEDWASYDPARAAWLVHPDRARACQRCRQPK